MKSGTQHSIQLNGRKHLPPFCIFLLNLFTFGFYFVICRNSIQAEIYLTTRQCELADADCIELIDSYGNVNLCEVKRIAARGSAALKRYVKCGWASVLITPYGRLIYDHQQRRFALPSLPSTTRAGLVKERNREEEERRVEEGRVIYGPNKQGVVPTALASILISCVCDKFFLWQIFCLIVWIAIGYKRYALFAGTIYAYLFVKNATYLVRRELGMRALNRHGSSLALRSGKYVRIANEELLPGDLLMVEETGNFACDAQLIEGNVVTEESFLTGETVPLCKGRSAHLFAGTRVVRASKGALAAVLRTGLRTKRGQMMRSLRQRRPATNRFAAESFTVLCWLMGFSLLLMLAYAVFLWQRISALSTLKLTVDLAITFFNPAMHSSIEMGAQYARGELARRGVIVTETARINTAGEVDMALFDKTGTLTEEEMEILYMDTLDRRIRSREEMDGERDSLRRLAAATCHTVIELDSQHAGDPLDLRLFQFAGARLAGGPGRRIAYQAETPQTFEVLQVHDFEPHLKRMSVVVRTETGAVFLFCKGAPDSLEGILDQLPDGYRENVKRHSLEGHRVITLAFRRLDTILKGDSLADQPIPRYSAEQQLEFLALVVFTNKLRPETRTVMGALNDASIPVRMCTGDGVLTAVSVARECELLPPSLPVLIPFVENRSVEWLCLSEQPYVFDKIRLFLHSPYDPSCPVDFAIACEGKEFELLTDFHELILERGRVFARFTPEQKKRLVEILTQRGFTTLYCGDGANDTGALSASDVGLSIAANDAFIAAPFSSSSLSGVTAIISEGRSALVMSAVQFKHALYTQAIQGVQIAALLPFLAFPSDLISLILDLMGVYLLGYALSRFTAIHKIGSSRPAINLRRDSSRMVIELFAVFIILFVLLLGFPSLPSSSSIFTASKHSTLLFFSIFFLLLFRAFLLADFGPFRTPRSKNQHFVLILALCALLGLALLVGFVLKISPILRHLELVALSDAKEYLLLAAALLLPFAATFILA